MANPGPLHDTSEVPGSASNPILIDDDDSIGKQYISEENDSDGDTVRLSTPEFWANVGGGDHPVPYNAPAFTDSPSVLTPLKTVHGQGFDSTCSIGSDSATCAYGEEKTSEAAHTAKSEETGGLRNNHEGFNHLNNDNPSRQPCRQVTRKRKFDQEHQPANRRSRRLVNKT